MCLASIGSQNTPAATTPGDESPAFISVNSTPQVTLCLRSLAFTWSPNTQAAILWQFHAVTWKLSTRRVTPACPALT
jgi:hypothetical protein